MVLGYCTSAISLALAGDEPGKESHDPLHVQSPTTRTSLPPRLPAVPCPGSQRPGRTIAAADRSLLQPRWWMHGSGGQGTCRGPVYGPGASLLVYVGPDRESPGRCPQAGGQSSGDSRQEPTDGEVFRGGLARQPGSPRADRRQARQSTQQGHGHRRPDGHYRQLQLHQGRRGAQRREPARDPRQGPGQQVRGQLAGALRPLRSAQGEGEGVLRNAPGRG